MDGVGEAATLQPAVVVAMTSARAVQNWRAVMLEYTVANFRNCSARWRISIRDCAGKVCSFLDDTWRCAINAIIREDSEPIRYKRSLDRMIYRVGGE
jgi:hypothetical protein